MERAEPPKGMDRTDRTDQTDRTNRTDRTEGRRDGGTEGRTDEPDGPMCRKSKRSHI